MHLQKLLWIAAPLAIFGCSAAVDETGRPQQDESPVQSSAPEACAQRRLCAHGARWSAKLCTCLAECPVQVFCVEGSVWSPDECKCLPMCVQNVLCMEGSRWSPTECACVPSCMHRLVCAQGSSWSEDDCRCVRDGDGANFGKAPEKAIK